MKLYFGPYACSLASHVALEELGVPFVPQAVDLREREQESAEYRAINPRAAVPALELPSGEVLTENIAILHWLAEAHPGAGLWPEAPLERARALEWMSLLATSFHLSARILWRTELFAEDESAQANLRVAHRQRYLDLLAQAELRLGSGPWAMGERFTVVDAHLLPYVRWPRFWKLDTTAFPNLQAWHARMVQRPAVLRALAREGQRP